jgi:hypothetical protein
MVTYVVRRSPEAREPWLTLVNTGRAAAAQLLHARILLNAAVEAGARHWTDAEMAEAWDTRASTVHRVRQAWVEPGLEAALARKPPTGRPYRTLDGAQAAQLIAMACRAPPAGRARGTLTLLADQLVALDIVDTLGPEGVRTTRKKTPFNPGRKSRG